LADRIFAFLKNSGFPVFPLPLNDASIYFLTEALFLKKLVQFCLYYSQSYNREEVSQVYSLTFLLYRHRMHILYIHQYLCPPGGAGNNRSFELAKYWVRSGHKVTFITSEAYFPKEHSFYDTATYPVLFSIDGIDVYVLDVKYSHLMPFSQRVRAFMQFFFKALSLGKKLQYIDIIYASSTPLSIGELGRRLARRLSVPYVFEAVDVWPDVPIGMGIIKNRWLISWLYHRTRIIYREAAEIVALSEGMKEQIVAQGVPSSKVHIIHNGVDIDAISFIERIPKSNVKVLYAGTVGIANDLSQLVWAAKYVEDKGHTHIHFTILGGGNDWDTVKTLVEKLRINNLSFKGFVPKDEVVVELKDADIGIVCFAPFKVLEANSANKFYDYLANGLPLVLNYEGWQAEYIREHVCGLCSPQGDIEGFAENIIKLANNPNMRGLFARNGRKLAERQFSRSLLAEKILGIFRRVTK